MSFVNLKSVLKNTTNNNYCIGAFNFNSFEDAQGIINAATKLHSPVILMASSSAVKYLGIKQCVGMIRGMAESTDIPVCLHLDHSKSVELCKEAVIAGFGSVMIDASSFDYDTNVKMTKEVVDFAHQYGVSVEGEIGHVGGVEDDISVSEKDANYTSVKDAIRFSEETGIDAMAVAIGTAHGFYKSEPKLDFERLSEIRKNVVPYLVLHGGTGVSDEDLQKCITCGISKINVGTQLKKVFSDTIRERCSNLPEDVVDPRKYIENVKINIESAVLEKLNVFRSENKA
jgi:ketose-bisphosphate aldolase, class II